MTSEQKSLADRLRQEIRKNGPIRLDTYMTACLADPLGGYYTNQQPLGRGGDFITAPETSQVFGELIGLWMVATWRSFGEPTAIKIIELGPGRGTLLADALRAMRVAPDFIKAAEVHLVEINPILVEIQKETLNDSPCLLSWQSDISQIDQAPTIIIANEFFDALPIRQFIKNREEWFERLVTIDKAGNFAFTQSTTPLSHLPFENLPTPQLETAPTDKSAPILEICPSAEDLLVLMAARAANHPFASLIIDYGHTETAFGETLQAVREHNFADPLTHQGQTDLTAHVDFDYLAQTARSLKLGVHGPITQSRFLLSLGLAKRVERLLQSATDQQASTLTQGAQRLIDPNEMGEMFKVIVFTSANLPPPVPFDIK